MPLFINYPTAHAISVATGTPVPSRIVVTSTGGAAVYPTVSVPASKLHIVPPFLVEHKTPVLGAHKTPVVPTSVPSHKSVVTDAASVHSASSFKTAVADASSPIAKLEAYVTALTTINNKVKRANIMKQSGTPDSGFNMAQQLLAVENIEKEFEKIKWSLFVSDEESCKFSILKNEFENCQASFMTLSAIYDFIGE